MSEFCLDNELKKWFNKWHRKVVTGRCVIELKDMNKKFIRWCEKHSHMSEGVSVIDINKLNKLAGEGLTNGN